MVELWQAILLLGAGTLLTLGSGYVQRQWVKSDTVEADKRASARSLEEDEREARHRVEEEERQERRRSRRERMEPILEFLALTKRHLSGESLVKALDEVYQGLPETKKTMTLEEFREDVLRQRPSLRDHPDVTQLFLSFGVALSTTPTVEITEAISRVFEAARTQALGTEGGASQAIVVAEEAVERYVIEV